MKRAVVFVIGLFGAMLCAAPADATWALVQHPNNLCTGASTCAVTLTQNTGSGNLLVISVSGGASATRTISSISAGGTFVHCSNCSANAAGNIVDQGWVLSSTGGVSSITVTLSGSATFFAEIDEYSTSSGPAIADTSGSGTEATCTSCAGKALALGGSNDVIVQVISPNGSASNITAPYSNPNDASASSTAGALNQSAGTAPTWTTTSGVAAVAAVAFKETPSAGVGCGSILLMTHACIIFSYAGDTAAYSSLVATLLPSTTGAGGEFDKRRRYDRFDFGS